MTVVIPAYNAAATLGAVLKHLSPQLSAQDDLVIVDDGSADGTADLLTVSAATEAGKLRALHQPHRGAAAARNAGVRDSASALVLFLGADIIPAKNLLARHRAVHRWYPEPEVGCLGFVTWDPMLPPSPLMVWLEHGGGQNAYGELAGTVWVDPRRYCYGANLSLKRSFFERSGGFDEKAFWGYGWEDLDLGRRLAAIGFRLYYEPTASAFHHHRQDLRSWRVRQRRVGRSFVNFARRHQDERSSYATALGWRGSFRRALARSVLGACARGLASVAQHRWIIPSFYRRIEGWEFTNGVHDTRTLAGRTVDNYVDASL